jgi:hypothetical protein
MPTALKMGRMKKKLIDSSILQKGENILDYVYLPTVAEYIVTND